MSCHWPNESPATPLSDTPSRSASRSRKPATGASRPTPRRCARSCSNSNASTTTPPISVPCNDVGYGVINAHAQRIREQLLRLNKHVTGHRLLRSAIVPGGARVRSLPDPVELAAIGADIQQIVDLALQNSVVL